MSIQAITASEKSTTLPAGKKITVSAPAGNRIRVWPMGEDARIRPQDNSNHVDIAPGESHSWGPYFTTRYFGFNILLGDRGTYEIALAEFLPASDVQIADADENFTATTVEAALAELAGRVAALE